MKMLLIYLGATISGLSILCIFGLWLISYKLRLEIENITIYRLGIIERWSFILAIIGLVIVLIGDTFVPSNNQTSSKTNTVEICDYGNTNAGDGFN